MGLTFAVAMMLTASTPQTPPPAGMRSWYDESVRPADMSTPELKAVWLFFVDTCVRATELRDLAQAAKPRIKLEVQYGDPPQKLKCGELNRVHD